ncbi:hypothetical protein BD779DRAFT_1666920 [Infundibulicybe gibba]|nr:hypothetical protein BD779DRAFT_1666920 [Infundibulicybe gibba]
MDPSFDSWPHSPILPPQNDIHDLDIQKDRPKKPRHRHSPAQLAALNDLYDKNEHPPLDQRASLAERLGMETKTVNAWFQNKRASSKKKTRGNIYEPASISAPVSSTSSSTSREHLRLDKYHDDTQAHPDDRRLTQTSRTLPFYSANPEQSRFLPDTENMPRRMRMRPTPEQTEELRKLYNLNPHPTTDQRQVLSERIGMRYQSITNWFQNQRSLAKKRREDDTDVVVVTSNRGSSDHPSDSRTYSAFPPPSNHPSLGLGGIRHPSAALPHRLFRSPSVSSSMDDSRGLPILDALKDLFTKTPTPSIEERTSLALEIGMDVGKVTNWFRNLRQTARKRAKRGSSADDDDDDGYHGHNTYSTSVSRSGTPSFLSSSSNDESMEMDFEYDDDLHGLHSDLGSEDDYQEAVTPSPELSPSPPSVPASHMTLTSLSVATFDHASYGQPEKVTATRFAGIKIEDALLLLSFHQHIVH